MAVVLSCDSHIISVKLQYRGIIYISVLWPFSMYYQCIGNFNIIFEPQYVGCSTIFTYSTLSIVDFYGYLILITEHSGKDMSVLIG
jgi:hypothetical protein